MKKISKIMLLTLLVVLITGCQNNQDGFDDSMYKTKGFKEVVCKIDTQTNDNSHVDINYQVFYNQDGYIEVLKSNTTVKSEDQKVLKEYYDAYQKIYKEYESLKYYDNITKQEKDQVESITYINYGKIDMDELMKIEGEEDNVKLTNGRVKLADWKSFAKKFGATCEDNE